MSSITVHNIDPEIDKRIRALASEQHTSLNQTIQLLLKEILGIEQKGKKVCDYSDIAGGWTDEDLREFEETTAELSKIDEGMWK